MRIRDAVLTTAAVAVLALAAAPGGDLRAQEVRPPVPHENVISANPFLLLFEWFNGEWERKLSESGTLAIGVSFIEIDDDSFRSLSAAYRYYAQNAALSGFYFGPRIGFYNVEEEFSDEDVSALGVGIELGYQWLLGAERQFSISLGIGATRLFIDEDDFDDVEAVLPSLRLVNVGWAF